MDVTETETPATLDDDLFGAAFDEAVAALDGKEVDIPEPETVEEPVATSDLSDTSDVSEIVEPPEPVLAAPAPTVDVKSLVSEIMEATRVKPEQPTAAETAPLGPTPEEAAAEEQFKKDWPEHAARETRLHKEIDALKAMLTETVTTLSGQIKPLADTIQMSAQERHLSTIKTAHPDAVEVTPAVEKWIVTQPRIYQTEMNRIMDAGSADEVVELFTLYKQATNTPTPKPTIDRVKQERLKKMETPAPARTSATAEADPNDFDAAYDEAVKQYMK